LPGLVLFCGCLFLGYRRTATVLIGAEDAHGLLSGLGCWPLLPELAYGHPIMPSPSK
jgi:hypothetical protein